LPKLRYYERIPPVSRSLAHSQIVYAQDVAPAPFEWFTNYLFVFDRSFTMRKRLLSGSLGLALVVALALSAVLLAYRGEEKKGEEAQAPKTANSRITHVTVYSNNALVTREVDVPEGTGVVELVVTSLPAHTVNTSLYSEGSDSIRVLNTRFRSRALKEDTREEVRKIENQIKELLFQAQKLSNELETVKQNIAMVTKLENFTAANTVNATEKGKLDGDQIITLSDYVMKQRNTYMKQRVDLEQQLEVNKEQSNFLLRQMQEMTTGTIKTERDAIIVVEKQNNAGGKVKLNYLVDQASWRPQYRFRASKKATDAVQIEYLAGVFQQTGEDWRGVTMTLSTAQPLLNASPPELAVLSPTLSAKATMPPGAVSPQFGGDPSGRFGQQKDNLDKAQKLRSQSEQEYNMKKEGQGGKSVNDAAALEQANELLWVERDDLLAKRNKGGLGAGLREGQSVTYHLANKLSVPSRTEEQVIEVTKLQIQPDYFYKAVPVLTPHVYRLANLTNKSEFSLLPGEATMYIGTDFVGRMDLPLVAIGEEFTAGFGVDPQVQVKREMMDKSRTMQGGNQVLKFEYRILISSYKTEPVKLQVWDRLPKAEQETVGVTVVKSAPELCTEALYVREQRPNNLLRWDMELKPGMSGDKALAINYEYKMELDKQLTIGGFQSK